MRLRSTFLALGLSGACIALAGVLPAGAAPPNRWNWPKAVTSGVPVAVSSITACPTPPTPGDPVLVQINLAYSSGGGSGQILPANSDGTWAGTVTFNFSGSFSGASANATMSAECEDFNGSTGVPYAQYQVRHTRVTPA